MKEKDQCGFATVEATLILPIFMAAMIAFLSFANLAILEMRMQYAVNQTAKEVSSYYYIAYKLGLNYGGVEGNENVDNLIGSVQKLGDTVDEELSNVNVDELTDTIKGMNGKSLQDISMEEIMKLANNIRDCFSKSPVDIIKTLVASLKNVRESAGNVEGKDLKELAGNTLGAVICTAIAAPIAEALFPKYIPGDNLDATLKSWNIKGGKDGLKFGASSFLMDGQTIRVVVVYEVELFSLGFWDFTKPMCQVASTRAWVGDAASITEKK